MGLRRPKSVRAGGDRELLNLFEHSAGLATIIDSHHCISDNHPVELVIEFANQGRSAIVRNITQEVRGR